VVTAVLGAALSGAVVTAAVAVGVVAGGSSGRVGVPGEAMVRLKCVRLPWRCVAGVSK